MQHENNASPSVELSKPRSFHLVEGYQERLDPLAFDDTPYTDEWQDGVYALARRVFDERGLRTVMDYGCGGGFKLLKYFKDVHTAGIEIEPTLSWLKATYPDRFWRPPTCVALPYDMVICSDVIEHVLDPDELIAHIKNVRPKVVVISTPDRSLIPGADQMGPPRNLCHVREWTKPEFAAYIGEHFHILSHSITNEAQATQCIVATP